MSFDKKIKFYNFTKWDYSPKITYLKCLAPAETHRCASVLILCKTGGGADLFRKTLAFLSFQMVQQMSIVIEAKALRLGMLLIDIWFHHEVMERCDTHSCLCMRRVLHFPLMMSLTRGYHSQR